jgi:Cu/Ag efflux pump CusA
VAAIEIPREVRVEWGGQFQNFNRAKTRLAMLVPVALGAASMLLALLALLAMLLQVAKRDEAEAAPAMEEAPSAAPAGSLAEPG